MELELNRGMNINVSDAVKNATSTVSTAFNNAFQKGIENLKAIS